MIECSKRCDKISIFTCKKPIKNIVISKNTNAIGMPGQAQESESSIPYIGKDDEYEDVFSNVLETNDYDNHSVNKNTINKKELNNFSILILIKRIFKKL